MSNAKPDYGIDAPGAIWKLALAGLAGFALVIFAPKVLHFGPVDFGPHPTGWGLGIVCSTESVLMLIYSKWGKLRHRDCILALHTWRGDEQVLDVGTGRGLLLVGAAKRLQSGHATGIDIWNKEDLSGNSLESTEKNLAVEGVMAQCTLVSENACAMSFADASFDVVVSNLCLHNIYDKTERAKALREIARVLRPGGEAILSDFKHTRQYAKLLREAGLDVRRIRANWIGTFPPLAIVVAKKMEASA